MSLFKFLASLSVSFVYNSNFFYFIKTRLIKHLTERERDRERERVMRMKLKFETNKNTAAAAIEKHLCILFYSNLF